MNFAGDTQQERGMCVVDERTDHARHSRPQTSSGRGPAEQELNRPDRVHAQAEALAEVRQPTPYMKRMGIEALPGVLTDGRGTTFIPAMDTDGRIWAMQAVDANGHEVLVGAPLRAGCFHVAGGQWLLPSTDVLMIAEGFATAATMAELLHRPAVSTFGAENLRAAAVLLRAAYPSKAVVIVARDDRWCGGRALTEAMETAAAVAGRVLVPTFAPGEQESAPWDFADFHDLAHRSALGRRGAYRQMRFTCDEALRDQRSSACARDQRRPMADVEPLARCG